MSNKIVCLCKNISADAIRKAINDGADTVEKVGQVTGAGTVCGACKNIIEDMIIHRT